MKATIQQLKQRTQCFQTNKHNLVSSGDTRLSRFFVPCLSIPEKLPRTPMEEYQNNRKDPLQSFTLPAQHIVDALKQAWVIVVTAIFSTST